MLKTDQEREGGIGWHSACIPLQPANFLSPDELPKQGNSK
jgi:hypothetical protein